MDEMTNKTHADQALLALSDLSVGYGGRLVITDIDLTLRRGDILGLLGANGSGKSTLIKTMTGQIRPRSGTVTIDDIALAHAPERAKARFGLAIDAPDLPPFLSGRQYLELVASIRSWSATGWPGSDLVSRLALDPWLDRPIGEFARHPCEDLDRGSITRLAAAHHLGEAA
ncbi:MULTISPECIES: ATP-binding cassette domain-containing protein [unclassified Mesorhizobium]|uniref:ATP-binding cassette domain-containing protein n=1 Tax=unclassified Mesorhizobium TaxID=325217 RepID=UPI001CD057B0|nr:MULTISPECIES: ATP-binding cassette domain-containing protein [unclassified Mesorhizobium]MBZ9894476.1 ATP-binding cassette domain-containing protein [Mesorhizobium sp. BR1-1-6]